jgi:hypothetical protein
MDQKQLLTEKLKQTISALVEVEVSAYLDGVGTVHDKLPITEMITKKKLSKQEKIEAIKYKAKKRFS